MFNKVVLVGRLTKDPELRYTSTNNLPVVSFTLAVNRPYASQSSDRNVDFINCTAWRKQAENIHKYCGKGKLILAEGKLQTRDYMDEKHNVRRYITEVVCDSVVFMPGNVEKEVSQESGLPFPEVANKPKVEKPMKNKFPNVEDNLPF